MSSSSRSRFRFKSISVTFAPTAAGAATPIYTIGGSSTGLSFAGALARDSAGNLYILNLLIGGTTTNTTISFDILAFGPTAIGNAPPAVNFTSAALNDAGNAIALK